MITETQVGIQNLTAGSRPPIRTDRSGAMVVVRPRTRFQEAVLQGNVFALTQTNATNYTVGAGNVLASGTATPAAAAVTNFCLWNPVGSGKNLVLWQFNLFFVSGTPTAGTTWHVLVPTANVTATSGTTIRNLNGSSGGSVANCLNNTSAAALTGGLQGTIICMANFTYQNTAQSITFPFGSSVDNIDGAIVIPQGYGWIPCLAGAGTSTVASFSIIWEEVPA